MLFKPAGEVYVRVARDSGSGFMGVTHAHAFAKRPDVQIVAVSCGHRARPKSWRRKCGAAATIDNMAIVNDPSIDAISVTLPTHLHVEYTIAALRSGKHVLLEKPFGLTVDDCDQIMAVEATTDKHLMLWRRPSVLAGVQVLVEMVRSGKLGEPLAALATRLSVTLAWLGALVL